MKGSRLPAACLLALFVSATAPAFAQDTGGDIVLVARDRFRSASRLAQQGSWAAAIGLYLEAQQLFASPTTLLNVGYCYEQLGDMALAYRYTAAALSLAKASPSSLDPERLRRAMEVLRALEARVAIVEVRAEAETRLLRIDGNSLVVGDVGSEPHFFAVAEPVGLVARAAGARVVLNAGTHVLSMSTARGELSRAVALREGERLVLSVPASSTSEAREGKRSSTRRPPAAAPATPPVPAERGRNPKLARDGLRQAGKISLVTAGGAALVGGAAGILAWSTHRELQGECTADGACPRRMDAARSRFDTSAVVADVGFAVAAAAGIAGVTLFLVAGSATSPRDRLSLRLDRGQVSLQGGF